jgi:ribokinase
MSAVSEAPRIIVVGSVMVDLIAYADPLPQEGQTVRGSAFQMGSGGKGANQAIVAHQLGSDVSFVARVGRDVFGDFSIDSLTQRGLDTTMVRRVDGLTTGTAPIWVQENGANRIIVIPGANDAVTAEVVATELAEMPRVDCVVCQLEIPEAAVEETLKIGARLGATTILNPAPAPSTREVTRLFASADWIVPNEHEFELLWGSKPTDEEIRAAAVHWGSGVIVTLGEEGAAASAGGEVVRRRPPRVQVNDTTGAGDAFVGGLAHALGTGMELAAAIELGNICGALSTESFGTQSSFPTRTAVERLWKQQDGRIVSDMKSL